jgi:serine phosphatase RsbU (regulator of sigma subunit)
MTSSAPFREAYEIALAAYVRHSEEASLELAHTLGRRALADGLGILDVVEHHRVTVRDIAAGDGTLPGDLREAALPFLLQSLAALDMATRGFVEAAERVAVEEAHVEQLHALADAFADTYVEHTLSERLRMFADGAERVLSADGALVQFGNQDASVGQPAAQWPATAAAFLQGDRATSRGVWVGGQGARHWVAAALDRATGLNYEQEGLVIAWRATEFGPFDEAVLAQFAKLASVTLRNARRFEREHDVALTLQSSLLPHIVPELDGLELAARYRPSGPSSGVGGDWFDVIELPGERVGLVIGDVMGHGIAAAAFMGQLSVALRAYAIEGHSPATVLDRLDSLQPAMVDDRIATVIYAIIEPDGRLHLANAGHPPPLVLTRDGQATFLTEGLSVPIGVHADDVTHHEYVTTLAPGATLLLYTDGLIERRDRPITQGLAELQRGLRRQPASLNELCDAALAAVASDGPDGDDVCLLAARIPDGPHQDADVDRPADEALASPCR